MKKGPFQIYQSEMKWAHNKGKCVRKKVRTLAVKDTSERVETMTSDGEYCFSIAFVSLEEGKMRRLSPF